MRVPWEVHVPDHFFWCSRSQVVSVSSGVSRGSDLCLPLQGLGPGKAWPIRDDPFFWDSSSTPAQVPQAAVCELKVPDSETEPKHTWVCVCPVCSSLYPGIGPIRFLSCLTRTVPEPPASLVPSSTRDSVPPL